MNKSIPELTRIEQINAITGISFLRWRTEYKNAHSRATVVCETCNHEWAPTVNSLITGHGCRKCSLKSLASSKKISKDEWEARIRESGAGRYELIKWYGDKFGWDSKATCRCISCHHEWDSTANNLTKGKGCPSCAGVLKRDNAWCILNIHKPIKILSINGSGIKSRVIASCELGHKWDVSMASLIYNNSSCPHCAEHGFNVGKESSVYALRSECGEFIKVGISNNPNERIKRLESSTPFKFSKIMDYPCDGLIARRIEKDFHLSHDSSGMRGFDGATEWLIATDRLLNEIGEMGR